MRESIYKVVPDKTAVEQKKIDKFNRNSKVRVYTLVKGKIVMVQEAPANEMRAAERARLDNKYDE